MAAICCSIISFYLRIFAIQHHFRRKAWVLYLLSGAWGIGSGIGSILLCIPPSNFWKMKDLDKCGSYNTFSISTSLLEIAITLAILALPVKPVMSLTLSLRTR